MRLAHDDPPEPALAALAALARRSAPTATPALLGRGWFAVVARLATRDRRRRALRRWSLFAATVGAAVVVAAAIIASAPLRVPPVPPLPLAYRVEGGSVIDGGYLKEAGNAGVKLRFVEGTELVLTPGSRGRLRSVDTAGARIAIEQGKASFRVTPQPNARWLVDVGPFLVSVTGTAFTVVWDAASERFELTIQEGQVVVAGPIAQGSITLRAGQRLAVNLPKRETLITEDRAARAGSVPATAGSVVVARDGSKAVELARPRRRAEPSLGGRR